MPNPTADLLVRIDLTEGQLREVEDAIEAHEENAR